MAKGANIILSETHSYHSKSGRNITKTKQLFFYRQSDGNPEGVLPVLKVFLRWIKEGRLRSNLGQCGSLLIILGAIEYNVIPKFLHFKEKLGANELNKIPLPKIWKGASFEPTNSIHGDIEFLYEIDITEAKLTVKKVSYVGEEQIFDSGQPVRVHNPGQTHFDIFH
jgi:hypothetical protein